MQEKVMQLIRPHELFSFLCYFAFTVSRQQLGTEWRINYVPQDFPVRSSIPVSTIHSTSVDTSVFGTLAFTAYIDM